MIEVSSGASKVVQHCLGQVVVEQKIFVAHIFCALYLIVDEVDIKALVYVFFKSLTLRSWCHN